MRGEKCVVTTSHRGVFFGEVVEKGGTTATLASARNCLYWPSTVKGFLGLASTGPLNGSRVGPAVESLELTGVTSFTKCTPEAIERWEAGPWA